MKSKRLNIRIPFDIYHTLKSTADMAGYPTTNQLVRCVLIQFVNHSDALRKAKEHTEWMDEMLSDHLDPTQRRRINERL